MRKLMLGTAAVLLSTAASGAVPADRMSAMRARTSFVENGSMDQHYDKGTAEQMCSDPAYRQMKGHH
jgi:hypothetical protein